VPTEQYTNALADDASNTTMIERLGTQDEVHSLYWYQIMSCRRQHFPPPTYGCHIFAVLGHILLYRLTATASIGLIFPSNVALKYPCVPKLSLMNPLRPRRVHNGKLLNHLTSLSLKNM
jgi:hypothetical protein